MKFRFEKKYMYTGSDCFSGHSSLFDLFLLPFIPYE